MSTRLGSDVERTTMAQQETADTVGRIKDGLSEFISVESELAKAELGPAAKHAGIGSGLFAGAGVFAFHAIWMLIITMALAIGWLLSSVTGLSAWGSFTLGFLITVITSLLIAFILFRAGQLQFRKVKKPEATIAEAKATLNALSSAIGGEPAASNLPGTITADPGAVDSRASSAQPRA
ncbi:MAG: phage holin family protein [Arachnia sp.]